MVDANVAIKWLIDEPLHEAAIGLIGGRISLYAPSLILAEIDHALCKKARNGEITARHAQVAGEYIAAYFDSLYPVENLTQRALQIALQLALPVYDCFYLACSENLGMPLVTADERLLKTVQATPFAAQIVSIASLAPLKA
ncbi:MAG: type II toxin-antitoxin system VapC family toxin [Rhodospirillales bacterium]